MCVVGWDWRAQDLEKRQAEVISGLFRSVFQHSHSAAGELRAAFARLRLDGGFDAFFFLIDVLSLAASSCGKTGLLRSISAQPFVNH
jgi:hypothetical protein